MIIYKGPSLIDGTPSIKPWEVKMESDIINALVNGTELLEEIEFSGKMVSFGIVPANGTANEAVFYVHKGKKAIKFSIKVERLEQ